MGYPATGGTSLHTSLQWCILKALSTMCLEVSLEKRRWRDEASHHVYVMTKLVVRKAMMKLCQLTWKIWHVRKKSDRIGLLNLLKLNRNPRGNITHHHLKKILDVIKNYKITGKCINPITKISAAKVLWETPWHLIKVNAAGPWEFWPSPPPDSG